MPRNVEIKAVLATVSATVAKARTLSGDQTGTILKQVDTFFKVPRGRLKLREFGTEQQSELIFYERSDTTGPKLSTFSTFKMAPEQAPSLSALLSMSLGIRGVVRKTRTLFIVGQTRVHVDEVDGLGDFIELEVMLRDEQTQDEGQVIAEDLLTQLGVDKGSLLAGAYIDMLEAKQSA